MKHDPTEITGITLIEKLLEFTSMTTDSSSWTFEKLKDNESRLVRLRQIDCLLKIFVPEIYKSTDLKYSIENVLNSNFIRLRKDKEYSNLFVKMDNLILKSKYPVQKQEEWTVYELEYNFKNLVNYKIKLNEILNFNDGIMEISYPYLYSYTLTNSISRKIIFKEIDLFLSLVIDPDNRNFSKEILVKANGYPDENVYHIDLDNW